MKHCPENLGELGEAIKVVARLWLSSEHRPVIQRSIIDGWSMLLEAWVAEKSLPLLIRRTKNSPGIPITHSSGRCLVPTDNSPALWVFTQAETGIVPTLEDIRQAFNSDTIPVAMAIDRADKPMTKHFCNLAKVKNNPNNRGWKLGHVERVGLGVSRLLKYG